MSADGAMAAVTDAAIGAILGEGAAQGAALNVLINLGSIKDETYVATCRAEIDGLLAEAVELRGAVMAITHTKL